MLIPLLLCSGLSVALLLAVARFSPYETHRLSGEPQRVGLIAYADDALDDAALDVAADAAALAAAGITNLNLFVRELGGRRAVFAYFETSRKGIDGLETVLAEHSAAVRDLQSRLTPHPRAEAGSVWLRMEWMNLTASTAAFPHQRPRVQPMGLVAGLKPECEPVYRSLHQTTWPGIADAMVRANHRNWTTFLVEDGAELYLFTYAEYIGDDLPSDQAVMAADPATQRWWKLTEPCLIDLHGEGTWSAMWPVNG